MVMDLRRIRAREHDRLGGDLERLETAPHAHPGKVDQDPGPLERPDRFSSGDRQAEIGPLVAAVTETILPLMDRSNHPDPETREPVHESEELLGGRRRKSA